MKNFVTTHTEATAGCITIKPKAKCTVPWESIAVREKRDNIFKKAFSFNKRNPINISEKRELTDTKKKTGKHGSIRGVINIVVGK